MNEKIKDRQFWVSTIGIFCVLFIMTYLVMAFSPLNPLRGGDSYTDSSVFKYVSYAMTRGKLPYRDSFDHKGPLIYFINLLGMQISFWRGVWIVEFAFMLMSFFFMYKIACLFVNNKLAIVTLLCGCAKIFDCFEGGNFTEEYSLLFIAASLYFFLDYLLNNKISKIRLILCGISFACVCMLRINMIVVWMVFCIAVALKLVISKNVAEIFRFIGMFLIGCIVVFAPLIAWMAANGILTDFYECYFGFNFLYASDASRASRINQWYSFVYIACEPVNLLAIILMIIAVVRKWVDRYVGISCVVSFVLTAWLLALSGMQYDHYGIVIIPIVVSGYAIAIKKIISDAGEAVAFGMIAIVLTAWCIDPWLSAVGYSIDEIESRSEEQFDEHTFLVENFIKDNTDEDDLITVYGNWDILYVISGRLSASRYSYQSPIKYVGDHIIEDYFADLNANRPKLVVIQKGEMDEDMQKYLDNNGYELWWSQTGESMAGTLIYIIQ